MIVGGAVGVLIGVVLADGPPDSETGLGLAVGLIMLALAVWHRWAWDLGKLAAIAFLAFSVLMLNLADFGDGELLWNQGLTGDDLAGHWVMIASSATMLVGSGWSLVTELVLPAERSDEVLASLAFWRRWWWTVPAVLAVAWAIGMLTSETDYSDADDAIESGPIADEWSIVTHLGDDGGEYHEIRMFTTLEGVVGDDVEALSGRLEWPTADLELCGVQIVSASDDAVQIGGSFPNVEQCEPAMTAALDEHGLPMSGCLTVRIDEADQDHCAPFTVDDSQLHD